MNRLEAEQDLKQNPDVVRKGRWFYLKNGTEFVYIQIIEATGQETVKLEWEEIELE